MIQDQIHKLLIGRCQTVTDWFEKQAKGLQFPFYSSYDIRDSGRKVVPVDANLFPAGFNNICQQDKEAATPIVQSYFEQHYPNTWKDIGLITEEHTNNSYYWENVCAIRSMLKAAGADVRVAVPRGLTAPLQVKTASGKDIVVFGAEPVADRVSIDGHTPTLLISNNDFSDGHEEWATNLSIPINPARELGWYQRRKHQFFEQYNKLAEDFAHLLDIDPFAVQVITESYEGFDVSDDNSRADLAKKVDAFILTLGEKYKAMGINEKPFAFVKNNAGTYGLAVIKVDSGNDVLNWNYKAKKKMKAAKGGRDVTSLIIQEGVPTRFVDASGTAEPCIYVVGSHLVGGFLRTHSEKSDHDSLNSPGAVYKRLCFSDMEMDLTDCPLEAVYGWVSRLAALAVAREAQAAGVKFKGYQ